MQIGCNQLWHILCDLLDGLVTESSGSDLEFCIPATWDYPTRLVREARGSCTISHGEQLVYLAGDLTSAILVMADRFLRIWKSRMGGAGF